MPLYDFTCPKCNTTQEVFLKYNSDTTPVCDCGEPLVKQVGKTSFVLKGDNWAGKKGY